MSHSRTIALLAVSLLALPIAGSADQLGAADPAPAADVATRIDRLIDAELTATNATPSPVTSDFDFLRRITLDLSGRLPSPRAITLFGLNPDSDKRVRLVSQLLESSDFSRVQAKYWRDVIFSRATEVRSRLMLPAFEQWMTQQFEERRGWNEIATSLLTASGDVRENGATALIFAQGGSAAELAAETSRIFLGIQIQCANCHDHPTDRWNRTQFHQLAAFFPRVRVRPIRDSSPRSFEVVSLDVNPRSRRSNPFQDSGRIFRQLDRNRDGRLVKREVVNSRLNRVFDRLLEQGDKNKDRGLSLAELRALPQPGNANNRRLDIEHFMPDLENPASRGTQMKPVFFATRGQTAEELSDVKRRQLLADYVTSSSNPWFARSMVNRTWSVLLGEGFSMPIDDLGPEREVTHPDAFKLLCRDFVDNDYDIRRLVQVITGTQAYQRQIRDRDVADSAPPFAATSPTRLRADQLYDSLLAVFGSDVSRRSRGSRSSSGSTQSRRRRSPQGRNLVLSLFGFDPSTPPEDIAGTVPQALFMMNSPLINAMIRAAGNTRLARILGRFPDNDEAVSEVYLLVLSREPTANELKICREYLAEVGDRGEAFEDLMWSLVNSSEFLSRR
ncbi:MAG: DUF1553 domain-containing protein [Planctomycetaceae bacterium]|jgi:hypothetical protein|nr:DUF1553 domain-containing protein [Planctomycetaceae bacterium]